MPLCHFYAIHGSSYWLKTLDVEIGSMSWQLANSKKFFQVSPNSLGITRRYWYAICKMILQADSFLFSVVIPFDLTRIQMSLMFS